MNVKFPYALDYRGRTAGADYDNHIRDMIEQVLFTSPGERVNRPSFGSGLMQLVFAPTGDELTSTTQFLVQSALQQWLGDVIQVDTVTVEREEATLRVHVAYTVRRTQERRVAEFMGGGPT